MLPGNLDIRNIPVRQMRELTIDLSSKCYSVDRIDFHNTVIWNNRRVLIEGKNDLRQPEPADSLHERLVERK